MRVSGWLAMASIVVLFGWCSGAQAEGIKIGISKSLSYPGVPIAIAQGYFEEQGLQPEMVMFDAAQPIAVAVASGGIDFGTAGMSASFYTLAAHGQLRLIAASAGDAPGFYNLAFVASDKAWDAGLKTVAAIKGHSVGITQVGTSLHYAIGLAAKRYGFGMTDITLKPLQSNTNVIAALSGGTVDAAVMPGAAILGPVAKGQLHFVSWTADVMPNPVISATFTSTRIANERGDLVKRFLVAYRRGLTDFVRAFVASDGKRQDGPTARAIIDILSKFTNVAPAAIEKAIPAVDPDGRLDAKSIADQIAWYRSQKLLNAKVKAADIIDKRYAVLVQRHSTN